MGEGEGRGRFRPSPFQNFKTVKAMTMGLSGLIVRRKLFPFTSEKWVDDVAWRGNYLIIFERRPSLSAILDF